VLNVVDGGGEGTFADGDDAAFHLTWWQAVVGPDDGDHGDVDVWKDVLRRNDGRPDSEEEQEDRHDDEGIWAPERQFYNPHTTSSQKGIAAVGI